MSPKKLQRALREAGFELARQSGGHDVYRNPVTGVTFGMPSLSGRHHTLDRYGQNIHSLRKLLREHGVTV